MNQCPVCGTFCRQEDVICPKCGHLLTSTNQYCTAPPVSQPYPQYYAPGYQPANNGLAIASMVLGIISLPMIFSCFMGLFTAVPAIIMGFISMSKINASCGMQQGKGMAIAGIACGFLSAAVTIIWIIVMLALVFVGITTPGLSTD